MRITLVIKHKAVAPQITRNIALIAAGAPSERSENPISPLAPDAIRSSTAEKNANILFPDLTYKLPNSRLKIIPSADAPRISPRATKRGTKEQSEDGCIDAIYAVPRRYIAGIRKIAVRGI
jgi:hypothetical protein